MLFSLFAALFLVLGIGYFFYGLQPQAGEGVREFSIEKGERFADIGARLSQEGLLRSIVVFKAYALFSGTAQKFQPGVYELTPLMSVPEIVRALTSHGQNEVTVTIPEGSTFLDAQSLLQQSGVLQKEEGLRNVRLSEFREEYPFLRDAENFEGFVFPDTYRFLRGSSPETILRRFLDTFRRKAWPELSEREDWYARLILASYLEREVPTFEDRRLVAGILLKREKIGMLLQVDATLSYVKCNGKFFGCPNVLISRSDRSLVSPYNTYERLHWTPTPISNPGQSAIRAALNPEPSSYLYYLSADKTGETIFSRTLEEHNNNRAKYL